MKVANEKRLIDVEKLEATIRTFKMSSVFPYWETMSPKTKDLLCRLGQKIRDIIEEAPTVDAVEVVHGEWIYHECVSSSDGTISGYSCSKCCIFINEETFDMDDFHKDFCGHCGAKMDGGNEDG